MSLFCYKLILTCLMFKYTDVDRSYITNTTFKSGNTCHNMRIVKTKWFMISGKIDRLYIWFKHNTVALLITISLIWRANLTNDFLSPFYKYHMLTYSRKLDITKKWILMLIMRTQLMLRIMSVNILKTWKVINKQSLLKSQ